ncbi:outer membrane biogenesis protein BamB [Neorhodopirellula pilleata]|uniref:Outer membrane biogenesis protein BamB n=2 Tax=Neorhodopirellula pilleata TaxID=2714738 RepID=A0A5C6AWN1_9BACT|nr:outer membrane biogenesis protein BamB [Neorhodopirellula pilleata]
MNFFQSVRDTTVALTQIYFGDVFRADQFALLIGRFRIVNRWNGVNSSGGRTMIVALAIATCIPAVSRADWTRFRGPNGSGIATTSAPTEFSEGENIKWKIELPGQGTSSPIVVGDKVFVTCYSGYGYEAGDIEDLKRHLICVDRVSGKQLWKKTIAAKMPEDPWQGPGIPTHGYASNTPASDGTRVFAFFGKSGVYAYDLEGNEIWNQSVGQEPSFKGFGSAASPIVTDEHVIVNAADESLSIVWLDKKTGKELHRAEADGLGECWTTPVLVTNGDQSEIALSVIGEVWGLDNATGKLSWFANGVNSRNAQVSLIVDDGIVYATGEESYAIRVDGKGDVSEKNTRWEGRMRTRYATPVLVDGHLFSASGSVVECVDAKTGERVFQDRLPSTNAGFSGADRQPEGPGDQDRGDGARGDGARGDGDRGDQRGGVGRDRGIRDAGGFDSGGRGGRGGGGGDDFASPVAAGGRIYVATNSGMVHVIEAKPEFKVIGSGDMTFDTSGFGGTPAISDDCLFMRSNTHLYCIGE